MAVRVLVGFEDQLSLVVHLPQPERVLQRTHQSWHRSLTRMHRTNGSSLLVLSQSSAAAYTRVVVERTLLQRLRLHVLAGLVEAEPLHAAFGFSVEHKYLTRESLQ